MFTVAPECLISCLICEAMEANEAIIIVGAEHHCKYTGYGGTFRF